MKITVAYALPETQFDEPVELKSDATVADALAAVARRPPFDALDLSTLQIGVFNRLVTDRSQTLREGDRVEIYRELIVDPIAARQQRAAAQRK